MLISATIKNGYQENDIVLTTNQSSKKIVIPGKPEGYGSSINGGELLLLSLATCFCNDIYREASRRKMDVHFVEVTVSGEFAKEGEPGSNIVYDVSILSPKHTNEEITALIDFVDQIAEVHNTLRNGSTVTLRNRLLNYGDKE